MKDVGFISLAYGVTFATIAVLVVRVLVAARSTSSRVPDEDKPWI